MYTTMEGRTTPWLNYLEALRPHLQGRDHRGQRGSLRWLEALMAERGGRAGAVRNILYKDLGSPEEKARLYALFADLYREAGLTPPPPPGELYLESGRKALGRDKRRIFRRFLRELELGQTPQSVVVGGAATGKGVLLSALAQALEAKGERPYQLNLGGELAQALIPLAEALGVSLEETLGGLSPTQPFLLQGALQAEVLALLAQALNQRGGILLLRAEEEGVLEGLPLRNAYGERVGLSAWLEPFLKALSIPYLAALSEPPPSLPYQPLSPPTREEARRFIRERLPHLPPDRVEALVNQAGRDFGELSRLVLLEAAKGEGGRPGLAPPPGRPLEDRALRPLLEALAAFSPEADPAFPLELLEKALGKPLERLSHAERALLEWVGEGLVRPALRSLLPPEAPKALHRLALEHFPRENVFRRLYHAHKAGAREALLELLQEDPARLALLPSLWAEAQEGWPQADLEALARAVVRYRAVLGQYTHPEALEALGVLQAAQDPRLRAWARIKAAEAKADAALYREAEELLPPREDLELLAEAEKAEGLLVMAAVERWKGDYQRAAQYVAEAQSLPTTPLLRDRVLLWRGLVAKDLGRYEEALAALGQVGHDPLLRGRALYQMGDLLMRLGDPQARARMEEGLSLLEGAGAPQDEVARIRARYATLLRRLGAYPEAERAVRRALEEAQDPFTRARVQSEAGILAVAQGHPFEALELLAAAERYFRTTEERPKEARYRLLRTLFRLGAAYLLLEAATPYRPPFLGPLQAPKAQALLEGLLGEIPEEGTERYLALRLDTVQLLALLLPPEEGMERLKAFLELDNPHLRAQARLGYAEALARAGRYGEVLAQLLALPPLLDPGLKAQARGLEILALYGLGEKALAQEKLKGLGDLPRPFRLQLGRALGRLLPLDLPPTPLDRPEALGLALANPD